MTPTELRTKRERLGFTQAQLAERLQLTANTIARWERGELKISKPVLLKLAMEHLQYKKRLHENH